MIYCVGFEEVYRNRFAKFGRLLKTCQVKETNYPGGEVLSNATLL
jgi:hypothetical protein